MRIQRLQNRGRRMHEKGPDENVYSYDSGCEMGRQGGQVQVRWLHVTSRRSR